jgi:hypothetical protein
MGISKQFFFVILVLLISLFESCRGYSVAPNVPNYFTKAKQLNVNAGNSNLGASAQVNYAFTNKYFLKVGALANTTSGLYGPNSTNLNGNVGIGIYSGNLRDTYKQTSLDFFSGKYESYYSYSSYQDYKYLGKRYLRPNYINAIILRKAFMSFSPEKEFYFGPHLGGGFGIMKAVQKTLDSADVNVNYTQFISEFGLMYSNQNVSERDLYFNFYVNVSLVGGQWAGVFFSGSLTYRLVR